MENMSDALRISFGVLVNVIALTITFTLISHAKKTSDIVLTASDKTTLYTYDTSELDNTTIDVSQVISTLYRYYKESVCITIDINGTKEVFDKDASDSAETAEEIEARIGTYIQTELQTLPNGARFSEEFVEVPISGIYDVSDEPDGDGTQITLSSGGKKVYVTYTYIP